MDKGRLSVREKIGYGMGDAGCNIIFGAIMLFVNYFYTDIFGLAPALVGVLLLFSTRYRCRYRSGDGRACRSYPK